jgi:hypothetical protein
MAEKGATSGCLLGGGDPDGGQAADEAAERGVG